jgi:hypothetical protein
MNQKQGDSLMTGGITSCTVTKNWHETTLPSGAAASRFEKEYS